MIHLFRIFKALSIPNSKSWVAEILRKMFTPHHVSHVTCHMLCVTCHMSGVIFFKQDGGVIWWRVCYQWGLPRLVLLAYTAKNYLFIFIVVYHSAKHPNKQED